MPGSGCAKAAFGSHQKEICGLKHEFCEKFRLIPVSAAADKFTQERVF